MKGIRTRVLLIEGLLTFCVLIIWSTTIPYLKISSPVDTQQTVFGRDGAIFQVNAQTQVCAAASSKQGDFKIKTPGGELTPDRVAGESRSGYGCYQPGNWVVAYGDVTLGLKSDIPFTVTTVAAPSDRDFSLGFATIFTIVVVVVVLLLHIKMLPDLEKSWTEARTR